MKNGVTIARILLLSGILFFLFGKAIAEKVLTDTLQEKEDRASFSKRFVHGVEIECRPGYVFPTNSFLQGENEKQRSINDFYSMHLKYSFQYLQGSDADRLFGGVYQGIGIARYAFGNKEELGNPIACYLFQGARIFHFSSKFSFNYEWNFGLSLGWKHYDQFHNHYNVMMGSKVNAYLNTNFYLSWNISPDFDLRPGISLTHFSNGNTRFPNAGINMMSLKVALAYRWNRDNRSPLRFAMSLPAFPRHVSYDLVAFGSWRRKGYFEDERFVPSPKAYEVVGINVAAMYNFGYKFRAGIALDGVYDASANVFVKNEWNDPQEFVHPPFDAQIALGISGRAEYVMPYFIVGIGMGANVLHRGGDLSSFYQMLILKIAVTRNSFLHVGYRLKDFQDPDFLMLGIGFRLNNKYPVVGKWF